MKGTKDFRVKLINLFFRMEIRNAFQEFEQGETEETIIKDLDCEELQQSGLSSN